jgi:hypothetical protein
MFSGTCGAFSLLTPGPAVKPATTVVTLRELRWLRVFNCTPDTNRTIVPETSARIWSLLNGPFDTSKQNP